MTAADAVTVIIVAHDAAAHLPRCLGCLAAQTHPPERLLVYDNASRDGSAAVAEAVIDGSDVLRGRAEVHRLETNVGFAAANNLGVAVASTPLVALLNPDAFAEPDWLACLVAAAAAHPRAAAFGSRQMLAGRTGVVDGLGDRCHVGGLVWRSGHGRRLADADLLPGEIFSPCAAAALYRTELIRRVGGFDESFFCFVEDVDLGFRLRLAGHSARLVPDAVAHHVGGGGATRDGGRSATFLGHRNLVWSYVKNMPAPLLVAFLPLHLLQTILAGVVLSGRGEFMTFARAKYEAIRGLPAAWRRRREIQAARVASTAAILRVLDTSLCGRG
ncbi:MAG: glycosyltransferase family 2 protein [Planctomycetaceae bacterium]